MGHVQCCKSEKQKKNKKQKKQHCSNKIRCSLLLSPRLPGPCRPWHFRSPCCKRRLGTDLIAGPTVDLPGQVASDDIQNCEDLGVLALLVPNCPKMSHVFTCHVTCRTCSASAAASAGSNVNFSHSTVMTMYKIMDAAAISLTSRSGRNLGAISAWTIYNEKVLFG